jgi:hypothetical protein
MLQTNERRARFDATKFLIFHKEKVFTVGNSCSLMKIAKGV